MADQTPKLPEREALLALIQQRFQHPVTTEQFQFIEKGVEAVSEMLAELRAVPLANHEEPFTSFIPYHEGD